MDTLTDVMNYLKSPEAEREYPILKKEVLTGYDRKENQIVFYAPDQFNGGVRKYGIYVYDEETQTFFHHFDQDRKEPYELAEMMGRIENIVFHAPTQPITVEKQIPGLEPLYGMERELEHDFECSVKYDEFDPYLAFYHADVVKVYYDLRRHKWFFKDAIGGSDVHVFLDCKHEIEQFVSSRLAIGEIAEDEDDEDEEEIDYANWIVNEAGDVPKAMLHSFLIDVCVKHEIDLDEVGKELYDEVYGEDDEK